MSDESRCVVRGDVVLGVDGYSQDDRALLLKPSQQSPQLFIRKMLMVL
jgi:hypothetical protein